ncbi:MAG: DUF2807 domain-containing protein [Bacteroidales bacterium]|nr:DUF2807 domain-containing protein [Bacteroidales bacterium]
MKTKNFIYTITLLIAIIVGPGAKAQVEKSITTEPFTKVKISSFFKATLIKGNEHKVVYNVDEDMEHRVEVEISDNTLKLEFDGNGSSALQKNKVPVDIYYVSLSSVEASGISVIKTQGPLSVEELTLRSSGASEMDVEVEVDRLYSKFSGATTINLRGRATMHTLDASGASNVKAYRLKTETTEASVSGASMAYLSAEKKLSGNVSGVAKLQYDEAPKEVEINKSQSIEERIERKISAHDYSDSVNVKMGKFNIQVIDDDTMTIRMGRSSIKIDDEGNVEVRKSEKLQQFEGHWSGFFLGVNGLMDSDQTLNMPTGYEALDLKYEKSIDVQINFYEQNINLIREKFGIITGLGLQWDNYRFDNDVLLSMEDDTLSFDNPDPDRSYKKSKLLVTYLNVPLLLEFQTNNQNNLNSFHLSAGVIGGWRIGSHSKVVSNGRNKNKERDNFYTNPFRADAALRIGWGKINLYGSYNLIPLFKDNKGPELYPFNLGIQIVDF